MWKYYIALFFMLCVGFMSCGQSQEEKLEYALREVERLDAMRKKVSEILKEQQANILLQTTEYNEWVNSQNLILLEKLKDVVVAEKRLAYWKNWHLREERDLKAEFESSKAMDSWRNKGTNLRVRVMTATDDTVRRVELLKKYRGMSNLFDGDVARHEKLLEEERWRVFSLMDSIEYHSNNPPKPSYKVPLKRTDKISEWEKILSDAQKVYDVTLEKMDYIDATKHQTLDKLRADLKLTQASYDSINVLHTSAVVELSKK